MQHHYKLAEDGRTPIKVTWEEYIAWRVTDPDITVKLTHIGAYEVSTVFLGMDMAFGRQGTPVLWETMIFGGRLDARQQYRHTSYEAAVEGHEAVVALVRKAAVG